jgi:hypothetical protein
MNHVSHPRPLNDYYLKNDLDSYADVDGLKKVPKRDLLNQWLTNEYYPKYIPKKHVKESSAPDMFKYIHDPVTWANNIQYGDKNIKLDKPEHMMDYRPGMNELEPKPKEYPDDSNRKFNVEDIIDELDTSRWGSLDLKMNDDKYIYTKRAIVTGFPSKTISSKLPMIS